MTNQLKLNLKGYTCKQYAVLLMRDDLRYTLRQISERLNLSESAIRYILQMRK